MTVPTTIDASAWLSKHLEGDDGDGDLAEALLGLPGFRALNVVEMDSEVVVSIESTATRAFCHGCGERAEA